MRNMSERISEEFLQKFIGLPVPPIKLQVRGKTLVEYAEAIGSTNPKYIGDDPIAHPSYVGTSAVLALINSADVTAENDEGEQVKLIKNPLKVVHGGQNYKFSDVPVKDGDLITTEGIISNVVIKGDNLFLYADVASKNQNGEVVLETTIYGICTKGGW
jgi:hypothetical protein